jgi:hypothetical protein
VSLLPENDEHKWFFPRGRPASRSARVQKNMAAGLDYACGFR